MAAQGFAAVQPGQGPVQQRGTAHLAPCRGGAGGRKACESGPPGKPPAHPGQPFGKMPNPGHLGPAGPFSLAQVGP